MPTLLVTSNVEDQVIGTAQTYDTMIVDDGGHAYGTTVEEGGNLIATGGVVTETSLLDGGVMTVDAGGYASYTSVGEGGDLIVTAGYVSDTQVLDGGVEHVSIAEDGATSQSDNSIIYAGGSQIIEGGFAFFAQVGDDGFQQVGATADGLHTGHSDYATVLAGGTQWIVDGGVANGTQLNDGAYQTVFSGGEVTGTTVDGGTQNLSGGTATDTALNSGEQQISAGGSAFETTLTGGSTQNIDGGYASGTTLSHSTQYLYGNAEAHGTTIGDGATQVIDDSAAVAYETTVESGGLQEIYSGTAIGTLIEAGGQQEINYSGSAYDTTVYGDQTVWVYAEHTSVESGGVQYVAGLASDTEIQAGGVQYVSGEATDTTIHAGGLQEVWAYGVLHGFVSLLDDGAHLQVEDAGALSGVTIQGFSSGDSIDLNGLDFGPGSTAILSGGVLTVSDGSEQYSLQFEGDFSGLSFTLSEDGDGSTVVTLSDAPCYLAGTRILTPTGERLIEALSIGDLVMADGLNGVEARRVKWMGRRAVATRFADPLGAYPVRIRAGALGEGLPRRDLLLSPDHAVMIEGRLVQAGALVNGCSIVRLSANELPTVFTYHHIELAEQALVLAEGVLGETFVDNVTRGRFDNFAEYLAIYGEETAAIQELELPRIKSGRQLPRDIRERLARRAEAFVIRTAA